ncbi:unnamed protein product, partial [Urochloa humidicola]
AALAGDGHDGTRGHGVVQELLLERVLDVEGGAGGGDLVEPLLVWRMLRVSGSSPPATTHELSAAARAGRRSRCRERRPPESRNWSTSGLARDIGSGEWCRMCIHPI